ncbi:hypothetical protein H4582DRAFT_1894301 [Lactarius indigo]|nr:hypothetical protein H4582DRAFT_1894301 [Lactarius indigo]
MGLFFLLLSEVGSMDPPMFPFPGNSMSPMDRTRSHTTTSTTDHIRRPGTSPMYHIGRTSITPMYPGAFVTPTPGTFVSPFVTPTPGAFVTPTPGTFVPPHNPTLGTTVFPYPTTFPVFPIPRSGDAEKSDVWDVVQQTFSILFHALPAATDIEHSQVGKFGGGFGSILQNWLGDLFKKYTTVTTPGSPPLTNEVRITCLKSLWYYEIACHRLRAPRSLPALDLFPIHLITPEIAHRLHSEVDPIIRVIWRCFSSLVVNRLATKFDPLGDRELAFISAIIGPGVQKTIHRPGNLKPGAAIQLVNVINLASNILGSLVVNTVPSEVQHMVRQTISTLAQAIPAEFKYLDQAGALMNIPDSTPIKSVVVSIFRDLLKTCTLRTLPLSEDDQADYLKICLESLCNLGQRLHWQRRIDSQPSGPEFLDLASSEITLHIRTEKDEACRVIGRCIEALVVNHLAARTDSTVQISDEALGRISAILGTENRDLRFLLGRLGTVELPNVFSLLFSEIDFLFSDSIPSDVLDMIEGTLIALSPAVLAELNAELMNPEPTDVSEKLPNSRHRPRSPEPVDTHPRTCLKYLWHCARAYNRLGAEMPLPSFVRITLANPGITWRTGAARDVGARVIGRCFGALIINKLVDDFKPRTSLSSGVYDAELACISSILDTRPGEILRWPQPSAVIKLLNVVSLMSGEIEILITSGIYAGIYASPTPGSPWSTPGTPYGTRQRSTPMPVDILNIVQQTINIISPDLVLGGAFAWGDLPMDQVSQLREICSKIADARPDNRFKKQTMGILDQLQQISKRLPTVEYKMRRCTSSIFSQQFVKGRSDSTTRPEYEVRRRRSKSI